MATVVGKSGKETFSNEVAFAAEKIGEDMRGVATGGGWTAWQNLWKAEPWKTFAKSFAKAPALAVGEVTLKFAASGAVTASGKFVTGQNANGTDVIYSATCSSVLVPKAGDTANYQLYLYFPPKDGKFKGYAAEISLTWDGEAFALAE